MLFQKKKTIKKKKNTYWRITILNNSNLKETHRPQFVVKEFPERQHTFQRHKNVTDEITYIAHKMKFFIKDFFSKCDHIRSFLWIWSYFLKNSSIENFIFCAVIIAFSHSFESFTGNIKLNVNNQLKEGGVRLNFLVVPPHNFK